MNHEGKDHLICRGFYSHTPKDTCDECELIELRAENSALKAELLQTKQRLQGAIENVGRFRDELEEALADATEWRTIANHFQERNIRV